MALKLPYVQATGEIETRKHPFFPFHLFIWSVEEERGKFPNPVTTVNCLSIKSFKKTTPIVWKVYLV